MCHNDLNYNVHVVQLRFMYLGFLYGFDMLMFFQSHNLNNHINTRQDIEISHSKLILSLNSISLMNNI